MFEKAIEMTAEAVKSGVCPSAAVAVGTPEGILAEGCFGVLCCEGPVQQATPETLYDMASLTKILATTMVTFRFIEKGLLRMDDTLGHFFPGILSDKADITLRQLMTHSSGIPSHFFLSETASGPSRAAEAVLAHPLDGEPGRQVSYSCMGFILLGKILEMVGGKPLDKLAAELVFEPLGMASTGYCPHGRAIAATERCPESGQWLRGVVHDENARFLKGVSGNAGIFSSLRDMERFGRMLAGGGVLDGKRFVSKAMLQAAIHNYTPGMAENRGLGFKLAYGGLNFMGDLVSVKAFGHTGFTGTSLVVDPDKQLFVVLLTNRVHPTRENLRLSRFRGLLHNRVFAEYSRRESKT